METALKASNLSLFHAVKPTLSNTIVIAPSQEGLWLIAADDWVLLRQKLYGFSIDRNVAVDKRTFLATLNAMDSFYSVELSKQHLIIKTQTAEFKLALFLPEDRYFNWPENYRVIAQLSAGSLKKLIAGAEQLTRHSVDPSMKCVQLLIQDNYIESTIVNPFQALLRKTEATVSSQNTLYLSDQILPVLTKMLSLESEEATITIALTNDNRIVFKTEEIDLVANAVSARIPDANQIIPSSQPDWYFRVKRKQLIETVERMKLFAGDLGVFLYPEQGMLAFQGENMAEATKAQEQLKPIEISPQGEKRKISVSLLKPMLKAMSSEDVTVKLYDKLAVIESENEKAIQALMLS